MVSWLGSGSALSEKAELALPSSPFARERLASPLIEQAGQAAIRSGFQFMLLTHDII
jgi:hypothetical protein